MKKLRMFWMTAVALAALVCAMFVMTACSSAASITATYVNGSVGDNGYGGHDSTVAQLNLYDDGTYDMVTTTLQYGYGMNLGTTSITVYGTYTEGATTDGYTEYTLSDATRVVLNSYSTAGGFNIYIDTELTTEYPAELPAETEGEKTFAQSAQDVLDKYGKGTKVYVGDKNVFELTNPAA
mgnify:CR=1 FL=1